MYSEQEYREPVVLTRNSYHDRQRCPVCGSRNLTVTAEHEPDGYNGYKCDSCGCRFGN